MKEQHHDDNTDFTATDNKNKCIQPTRIAKGDFFVASGVGTVLDGSPTLSGLLGVKSTNSVSQTRNLNKTKNVRRAATMNA